MTTSSVSLFWNLFDRKKRAEDRDIAQPGDFGGVLRRCCASAVRPMQSSAR